MERRLWYACGRDRAVEQERGVDVPARGGVRQRRPSGHCGLRVAAGARLRGDRRPAAGDRAGAALGTRPRRHCDDRPFERRGRAHGDRDGVGRGPARQAVPRQRRRPRPAQLSRPARRPRRLPRRRAACGRAPQEQAVGRGGAWGVTSPGSVTETDRRALLRAYREKGDVAARDRLIESFIPVVRSIAYRYAGRGEQLDDLEQVASVGLIKAIERFDLDRDVELMTYVFPTVVGELKRHFRDRGWSVTVPRRLKELHYRLSRLIEELTATLGRSPTIAELAEEAGVDEEEVVEALEVGRAYASRSLTRALDSDEGAGAELIDLIDDEERGYEAAENRELLASGLKALDDRERKIVQLRFVEGLIQSQIAVEIGITERHVSRLSRRPLEKLSEESEET